MHSLSLDMKLLNHERKVNSSTPRPEGRGLLRVDPERRFFNPTFKGGPWRRRMGQSGKLNGKKVKEFAFTGRSNKRSLIRRGLKVA